jgi:hypothetical protein
LDGVGNGSADRSTVAGDRAAAGTPSAGQAPAISCSGEVESTWGSTAEASAGFIGAGAGRGHARGLARRDAGRAGSGAVCEFQGKISPRSEDFRMPNLACPTVHSATKVMPNQVKRIWLGFKLFQWVP